MGNYPIEIQTTLVITLFEEEEEEERGLVGPNAVCAFGQSVSLVA
jgi:hypothetical protein